MKKIIYTLPDGRLCVVKPIISRDDPAGFTEADALARALAKDVPPAAVNVRVVDGLGFPDRAFRDAWTSIGVDMAKARAIHRDRLRAMRAVKLAALDAIWMKATAAGDAVAAAVAESKRQELRDAPTYPAIDAATTPEELKAAIPPILA